MMIEHTSAKTPGAPVSARAAPLTGLPRTSRFYLVGEAERSTRRPAVVTAGRTSISINGRWHALRGKTATFEQLVQIAFPGQELWNPGAATVSYRHGVASAPEGLLTPGDAIPLTDGLQINANATSAS